VRWRHLADGNRTWIALCELYAQPVPGIVRPGEDLGTDFRMTAAAARVAMAAEATAFGSRGTIFGHDARCAPGGLVSQL